MIPPSLKNYPYLPFVGREGTKTEAYPCGHAVHGGKLNGCREFLSMPKGKVQYRDFSGGLDRTVGGALLQEAIKIKPLIKCLKFPEHCHFQMS